MGPHIGWANAIPDAVSTVDLVVDGTRLDFTGAGYHDKVCSPVLDAHGTRLIECQFSELERPALRRERHILVLGPRPRRALLHRLVRLPRHQWR